MYYNIFRVTLYVMATLWCTMAHAAGTLTFTGALHAPVDIDVDMSSGLTKAYVTYSTNGLAATYTLPAGATGVRVQVFDYQGAAYATDVPSSDYSVAGRTLTLHRLQANSGYAIMPEGASGLRSEYFYIVDWSLTPNTVSHITPSADQDCDRAWLDATGAMPAMYYTGITGRRYTIARDARLEYATQVADQETFAWVDAERTVGLDHIGGRIGVEPPLCNTVFTLGPDRFERAWGVGQTVSSAPYSTMAVDALTQALQTARDVENEQKVEATLGGSAPCEIEFKAAVSDATVYHEWQFATTPDFYDILFRTPDLEFTHTFRDMGTTYVRFTSADASGRCTWFSETYEVSVGESSLLCPNAFSPGASEGVNDEWRVSYKSIIDFECCIFNRWGEKMFEFHDPALGWDGRYRGKLVPAGVYYYVIKAFGSDGKKYKLSGDINIVRYERR